MRVGSDNEGFKEKKKIVERFGNQRFQRKFLKKERFGFKESKVFKENKKGLEVKYVFRK